MYPFFDGGPGLDDGYGESSPGLSEWKGESGIQPLPSAPDAEGMSASGAEGKAGEIISLEFN